MSINNLILLAIDLVAKKKEKCSFGRLVKECFSLSPETFCLSKYPAWPDSRKLDRPLRILRNKKLIALGPGAYLSLTKGGKRIIEEITKASGQQKLEFAKNHGNK